MIELLKKKIPIVYDSLLHGEEWDSLIINRRKPWTYRVFRQFGDYRVCLHGFHECESDEAFLHPHPWPGAFLLLQGSYIQRIGFSQTKDKESAPELFYREILNANSTYEILNQRVWHSVQPLSRCYTIMLNGKPWEEPHQAVRTTKGKDLDKMPFDELQAHKKHFIDLLERYMGDTEGYYHDGREWKYYESQNEEIV